jgi:integrase
LVFTKTDGSPMHPAEVTDRFHELTEEAGLPPIRLHDLRHVAATLALAAGVEMQAMLRHASITTTNDLYTEVLPELARDGARRVASIIPRVRARQLGHAADHCGQWD